jgi:hypothetical protein
MCSEFKGWGFDQEGSQLWYVGRLERMVLALAMYGGVRVGQVDALDRPGATRKKQGSKATRTIGASGNPPQSGLLGHPSLCRLQNGIHLSAFFGSG